MSDDKYGFEQAKTNMQKFTEALNAGRKDRLAEFKKVRTNDPALLARLLVRDLHYPGVELKDIYVVWFCSAVANWKAVVSTNVKDNAYYEVTHNGVKGETYIDKYTKVMHHTVRDETLKELGLDNI